MPGSKTPTSKFSENKEVRWESTARKSPIGSTNNQWWIPLLIKVSLYVGRKSYYEKIGEPYPIHRFSHHYLFIWHIIATQNRPRHFTG
ncbi:hypothetical protein FJ659_00825 [Bacillus dicomae]|uniref:Uncharacterized protein n=1 Tax=Bacillus dicomae TaxID=3088378 RepID=A0AC61T8Q9_9BACI|nr:hypothetical protein FJ659_00825 [Bacillus dicomae]